MKILEQFAQLAERQASIALEPTALDQLVLRRQALFSALQKAADEGDAPGEFEEILHRIVDYDQKMQERVMRELKSVREELTILRAVKKYEAVKSAGTCIDTHG